MTPATNGDEGSASLPTGSQRGLAEADAQRRLKLDGYNELPRSARRSPARILLEVVREPMLASLLVAGLIYLALGDTREAVILLVFATMSVSITVVQESRTERVLEALRDLTSPRAMVIRDGKHRRIAGREVVRGDVIVLSEGDRVPADAILIVCHDLQIDESLLTGESVPVRKSVREREHRDPKPPDADRDSAVFSGTLVVRGRGMAEVTATGPRSEIGKIGQSLGTLETAPPRLQVQTRRIVRVFAVAAAAVSLLAILLYGLSRGNWLEAMLVGIAIGMSMLPEEFPVVLTIFVAMGAWRIARARVLTRRAATIETLGSATVLCTDKTGTLTENRMSIVELRSCTGAILHPRQAAAGDLENVRDLIEIGARASARESFDPMERAFREMGGVLPARAPSGAEWRLVHGYGLRPDLLAMAQIWQPADGGRECIVAAKGAPEAIADLCRLDAAARAALMRSVDAMAAAGLRVLGVARSACAGPAWPDSLRDLSFELLGLVGLADPLRPSVPEAVGECRSAGIKVVMITGDYPATARAIGRQAGLAVEAVVTGDDIGRLSADDLARVVRDATVFARILPEQKLRIVQALQANGEIVAMTGDGVNDAPALKAADIGIAMGARGTDVAREASSIVLLDDEFGSVVKSVRLGRRIFDNLRKASGFIVAVHVPIAGLALLPLLLGLPILLWPAHIAFLEMVIDPICSLVFEAETEEDDVMRRPPRAPDESLFSSALIGWGLLQGTVAFILVGTVYVVAFMRGMPEGEARALAFFSLVLAIVSLVLANRSFSPSLVAAFRRPNPALAWVLLAVAAILALTLLWPLARDIFRFGPLHADDLAATLAAGMLVLIVLELLKPFCSGRRAARGAP